MSNLINRIKNIVMTDLHEALEKKEKQNPIGLLNQYLRDCERETDKVRKLLERQRQLQDQFGKEYHLAAEMTEKRKRQAEIAKQAGEDQLFSFAVLEQSQYEERAARLKASMSEVSAQLSELEQKYEEMQHKLKDMHIRRLELMGKENATRARRRMDLVIDSERYADKPGSRFSDIETYLERLEQEADQSYLRSTIDSRIDQLEKERKKQETHTLS
ncbi:PspA/IM30 family protein [Mesobacillus zeae]|uniref:PspA/IM30 family protein n=1 Tax=Mesobacillus zeae TaxID=1917180 RepID=A0A398AXU8_9BACI|nr:PspA/IM30 family protein [Mesobacillus zeae]RID82447.1 PspA/IM30 family protein [Mesobacillus zeae]